MSNHSLTNIENKTQTQQIEAVMKHNSSKTDSKRDSAR
jgi:hypothetical protein